MNFWRLSEWASLSVEHSRGSNLGSWRSPQCSQVSLPGALRHFHHEGQRKKKTPNPLWFQKREGENSHFEIYSENSILIKKACSQEKWFLRESKLLGFCRRVTDMPPLTFLPELRGGAGEKQNETKLRTPCEGHRPGAQAPLKGWDLTTGL